MDKQVLPVRFYNARSWLMIRGRDCLISATASNTRFVDLSEVESSLHAEVRVSKSCRLKLKKGKVDRFEIYADPMTKNERPARQHLTKEAKNGC